MRPAASCSSCCWASFLCAASRNRSAVSRKTSSLVPARRSSQRGSNARTWPAFSALRLPQRGEGLPKLLELLRCVLHAAQPGQAMVLEQRDVAEGKEILESLLSGWFLLPRGLGRLGLLIPLPCRRVVSLQQ